MTFPVLFWLIVAFLFLIAELSSPGFFFFFSFFIGALITAASVLFISSNVTQLFIFLGGTAGAFLLLQLWIKMRGARPSKKHDTNIDALKGKRAIVVQDITPNKPGYVSISGVMWLARSKNNNHIEEGQLVEIVDVQGAHVLVEEVTT